MKARDWVLEETSAYRKQQQQQQQHSISTLQLRDMLHILYVG